MYKCKTCCMTFEEPKVEYEDRSPMGGGDMSFVEKFDVCPYCESFDYHIIKESEEDEETI